MPGDHVRSEGRNNGSKVRIKALAGCLAAIVLAACGPASPFIVGGARSNPLVPSTQQSGSPPAMRAPDYESDIRVLRGPYLQSVTDHSIVRVWQTDQPGNGQVAYGEPGTPPTRAVDQAVSVAREMTRRVW